MTENATGREPTVLTPSARERRRFPKWAVIALGGGILFSIIGNLLDTTLFDLFQTGGIVAAGVSGLVLAMWAEDWVYTTLIGRHLGLRILFGLLLPLGAIPVGFASVTVAAIIGDVVGETGALALALSVAMGWIVLASLGSLSVVVLDGIISAVVTSFRFRVQLAVLGLLALTSGLAVVVFAGGHLLTAWLGTLDLSSLPEDVSINIEGSPEERIEILSHIQGLLSSDVVAYAFFGIVVVLSVPAVLSATSKIAEAVMERLHPLRLGFRSVVEGKLDVRVEEAGSRDFVQLSQGFNRMTESLTSTLSDLDARNRDLGETNVASRRFVPFQFLNLMGRSSIRDIALGDHRAVELSILFTDIRGFTTLAEQLGPEATFSFINRYLAHMEPEIHNHGGFINDFIGDGIMALYHTDAVMPVQSAIALLSALDTFNEEIEADGLEPIDIGIGVNTGALMLGTIGGKDRLACTVIGDSVNLASRVEGMTKLYGSRLLITEGTYRRLRDPSTYAIREVDRVRAKGKREPVTIYEVLDGEPRALREQKEASLVRFHGALALYREADFKKADAEFRAIAKDAPDDGAVKAYLARCESFQRSGPPHDWTGVTELRIK